MPGRESAHRVVIADDDVLLREGLAALLREGGYDEREPTRGTSPTAP